MKKLLLPLAILFSGLGYAQQHACAKAKMASLGPRLNLQARSAASSPQISHELKYDVKFVHLKLNLERTNKNVSGGVRTVATVTSAVLDTFQTLLHQNHTIDSIRFNGLLISSLRQDSMIKVKAPSLLNNGSSFTVDLYYHGTPPNGGSAIGSGFSNGTSTSWGNQATWSLSESLVAYHWWPTKQILTDKIDSSWVFVTTDSLNKVGSNGLLKNVVVVGNKKRYEWKSRYPIDYYLISVAVAKYKEYRLYAKPLYLPNDSILIQNYIYDGAINNTAWIANQKVQLNKMPQVLEFESKMYGMYPFYKEKYGHCMAPFGGGMEHQTMTSLGFFDYYVDAHELGHHWWGDNVTCKSWGDIWINEGFASYTEHLVAQYLDPLNFAANLSSAHNNVMSQPDGSIYFTNHDTVDATRIFDSRLTYDKGGAIIHSLRFVTNNDSVWFNTLRGFQNTYKNSTASAVDFQNYYQTFTGINPSQFFNQWYYGEGFPTFNVRFNSNGTHCIIKSTQTVSKPSATPLFITPMEYRISRFGKVDTTIRVVQANGVETYSIVMADSVTALSCDPNNWIINKAFTVHDYTLGVTIVSPPPPPPPPPPVLDGVDELNAYSALSFGPNPCKTNLVLTGKLPFGGKLRLLDVNGRLLLERSLDTGSVVDMSLYANGLYFVKLYDASGKERRSKKILKQ